MYVSFEIYVNRSEPIHEVRDHSFFATRCFNIFIRCENERMLCNLCIYSVIHFHATISHRRGSNKINYKMHRTRRIVSVLWMVTENAMRIYRNDNYDAIRFHFHFHYHSVPKIHPAIHARHAEDTIQNYTKCIKANWEMWTHSFHSEPSSITELCESAHLSKPDTTHHRRVTMRSKFALTFMFSNECASFHGNESICKWREKKKRNKNYCMCKCGDGSTETTFQQR